MSLVIRNLIVKCHGICYLPSNGPGKKKKENATAKMGKILRKTQGGNPDLCSENKVLYLLSLGDNST